MFFRKKKSMAYQHFLILGLFLLMSLFFFISSALQFQKLQELQSSVKVLAQEVVTLKQSSFSREIIEHGIQATIGIFGKPLSDTFSTSSQFLGSAAFVQTSESSFHIVTNYHVIAQKSEIQGKTYDGKNIDLEVVSSNQEEDIAILACKKSCPDLQALVPAEAGSIGMPTLSIGFHDAFPHLIFGHILGLSKEKNLIISSRIASGDSGGPVLNIYGELIGISQGFSLEENVSFAIPTTGIIRD